MEIRGRFLPSRVYSRWKWTVRFGLLIVPFLSFLAGGLTLYLTPGTYRSTTLIELENGPATPKVGPELHEFTVQSLISGLFAALLLPYLMELAFPPRHTASPTPDPVDAL